MGWNISVKKNAKETKYKIWCTVTDSYLSKKWLTRKEVINFLFWSKLQDFMEKFVETSITFPNGWTDKDEFKRITERDLTAKYQQIKGDFFDEKSLFSAFESEIKKQGISFKVKDADYLIDL